MVLTHVASGYINSIKENKLLFHKKEFNSLRIVMILQNGCFFFVILSITMVAKVSSEKDLQLAESRLA